MPKAPFLHQAERVDLVDLQYGLKDFPIAMQGKLLRSMYGSGVLDGFRVRIPDQSGGEKGQLIIYNGLATDWNGGLINSETGTNFERIVLSAANMEYWIEVELDWADSTPDSRAFWDPLVDNVDPIPDGREVNIPRTMTRKVPFWRIKRPIRSNPIGLRSSGGYTPSHFSPATENVIPIAVIRTNNQRQIVIGDANTDAIGNDIVPVLTQEDLISPRNFLKVAGYGEYHGTATAPYGRKFSDQRPRIFDPLLPSFQYGSTNEVMGESLHDGWARDIGSVFDHLASQIKQIKTGAGDDDHGMSSNCTYVRFADDFSYVDVKSISQTIAGDLFADPDQFIGCTFQITTGHWAGFYASIMGSDRTGHHSAGETRIYLGRKSPIAEWMELPRGTITCKIVQHREVNWLTKPCPSTDYRGLNDLDTEVYSARTDWHSNVEFDNLRARLNAGKLPTLTVSPPDPLGSSDGEPATPSHPRADVYNSISDIQAAVTNTLQTKGGLIYFRRGTYDFSSISGTTAFSVSNVNGFVIEGDGRETTILEKMNSFGTIFMFIGCKNLVFRNLTIRSVGMPLYFSGCEKVVFENCTIEGSYNAALTETIHMDNALQFVFENCDIYVSGRGLASTAFIHSTIHNCRFYDDNQDPTKLTNIAWLGVIINSRITDTYLEGYVAESGIYASGVTSSTIEKIVSKITVLPTGNARFHFESIASSQIDKFSSDALITGTTTPLTLLSSTVTKSYIGKLFTDNSVGGISITSELKQSHIECNEFNINSVGVGIAVASLNYSTINKNGISCVVTGTTAIGIQAQAVNQGQITQNIISSDAALGYGIKIEANTIYRSQIDNNEILLAQVGVGLINVFNCAQVSLSGNQTYYSTSAAYRVAVGIELTNFTCIANKSFSGSGLGLDIAVDGCAVRYSHIDRNELYAQKQALCVHSLGGGSFVWSSLDGNICYTDGATGFCPLALGTSNKSITPGPGSPAMVFRYSSICKNIVIAGSSNIEGGMYLSSIDGSHVDGNIVVGFMSLFALACADTNASSMNGNHIEYSVGSSGGSGILLVGKLINSNVEVNYITVRGLASVGLVVPSGGTAIDGTMGCNIIGNNIRGQGEPNTYGMYVRKVMNSVINGNNIQNFDGGMTLLDSEDNMVSGNYFRDCTTFYIDATGGKNNRGGILTILPPPVDPKFMNDWNNGNILIAYNVGFN